MQTIKELAMTKTLLLGLLAAIQGALSRKCSDKRLFLKITKLQSCQLKLWPKSLNNACEGAHF